MEANITAGLSKLLKLIPQERIGLAEVVAADMAVVDMEGAETMAEAEADINSLPYLRHRPFSVAGKAFEGPRGLS
jgi:hypothetical protein